MIVLPLWVSWCGFDGIIPPYPHSSLSKSDLKLCCKTWNVACYLELLCSKYSHSWYFLLFLKVENYICYYYRHCTYFFTYFLPQCVEFSKLRKAPTWANKVVSRLCVIGEDVTNEPSHSSGSPPSSCLQMHPIPETTETNTDERHISSHSSSLPNAYSGPQADNSLKLYSGQQKTSTSDYASPGSTLQRGSGSINSSRFASHAYASRPGVVSRRSWGPGNEDLYLFESDSTLVSPCRKCAQAEVERRRRQRLASEESNKSAPMASVESLTSIDTESSSARGSLDIPEEKAKNRLSTHSEGYCYFVFHDMDETEIFPDPKPGNSFVTNAVIESNKRMSWDDSKNISPTLHLKRPESTQLVDRFGNVKGRTSVRDRYTLTYDNGRNSPHTSESQEETPKLRREFKAVFQSKSHTGNCNGKCSSQLFIISQAPCHCSLILYKYIVIDFMM